ncbi:hypothetical protein B0H10DRAFT_2192310 [Mycena sp. CBHHK59/15]|nr:hypothetical protein B0H10DRAFT_2192310 [Mycena sp. CBHHK59/15]
MSTTRRQPGRLANLQQLAQSPAEKGSAKVPAAPTSRAVGASLNPKKAAVARGTGKPKPEVEDASDEVEEDESEAESDTSEYGKRPSKRQKMQKSSSNKRKAVAKKTCYLTTIPLDVLFELFSQLEPKALLALSRTNHAFRSTLLSTTANGVWKRSRENVDGPDCPPDLSELRWARLLFNGTNCQCCGAKNIQRVDFGLRRRVCKGCLKANLVVRFSFRKHFTHLEDTILDLVPYTNIGGFAHGRTSRSQFYWKSDINEMSKQLAVYERDARMRVIGAQKRLEDFRADRIALVAAIAEHAAICTDWSRALSFRRYGEERDRTQMRYDAIKAKFMELGYAEADISNISHERTVDQATPLTDRIWKRIFPELEPLVQNLRDRRLSEEHEDRISKRSQMAEEIYNDFKKTLVPIQWRHLPGSFEVLQLAAFDTLVNAPDDVDVVAADFKAAMDALPAFVVSWTASRKTELAQLLDARTELGAGPSTASTSVAGAHSLDLATTVFECAQPSCVYYHAAFIGWDAAAGHRCDRLLCHSRSGYRGNRSIKTILGFSERGSDAAASLVALAGRNSKTATCAEMDKLDRRFLCQACELRMNHSRPAYPWRTAVAHFAASSHTVPQWWQLSEREAQRVKLAEGEDPTLSWSCNHCANYLDEYHTRAKVADHVKSAHGVADPKVPADLFRYLDLARVPAQCFKPNSAAAAQQDNNLKYHCKQCLGGSRLRREFGWLGLKSHLKDKHKIFDPVVERDGQQVHGTA